MIPRPSPDATRHPDVPARPLKLADGQWWGFARPTQRFSPLFSKTTDLAGRVTDSIAVRAETGYPVEIRWRWEELVRARETGFAPHQYEAFLSLAVSLLRRAHDVTPSEARALMVVADAELVQLVAEILALVGRAMND